MPVQHLAPPAGDANYSRTYLHLPANNSKNRYWGARHEGHKTKYYFKKSFWKLSLKKDYENYVLFQLQGSLDGYLQELIFTQTLIINIYTYSGLQPGLIPISFFQHGSHMVINLYNYNGKLVSCLTEKKTAKIFRGLLFCSVKRFPLLAPL